MQQTHGGDLDAAMARFGGRTEDWLDLSTGINPRPYPMPVLTPHALAALPTRADLARLAEVAARAYRTAAQVVPLAGASQAIGLAPLLRPRGTARLLAPTYGGFAEALGALHWQVEEHASTAALAGADLAVVVSPNNPDGRIHAPGTLLRLADSVGLLLVDESFADAEPGASLACHLRPPPENVVLLRSFGKFYGLAGLRLGFALAGPGTAARLAALAGPWPVSGAAITAGRAALADIDWQTAARARLAAESARLRGLGTRAGWAVVGATTLFVTFDTGGRAAAVQERLAGAKIWSRVFGYAPTWLRLGLPGDPAGWARLSAALDTHP